MRSKGSRFTLGVWGLRVCSLDVAQPFATVRNRSQLFARSPYGRAYGKFCKRGHFWRFHMWRCFVSCGRRGTSCHSDVFCNASKVVLCGRRNTFATFSEDVLQFSWQAQHFGGVHRHFAWQAQHFRRVVLRDFCKSHWQGGVKWRQGASVMKIDGSLARNIDFEVANFQVLRKTRRNTSIATKCENWRMSRRKCSFWCSHVSRLESLVFLWPRRVYGGSCKTYPFRRFPSRLPVVLRGKRGTLWHSNLVDNSTFYTLHFTLHTPHFALHTLHSTLYTLHSTLHTLHFTLRTLHSTFYTLHFTLYTLHPTLYTPRFTLDTLHSALYTVHSTLHTLHSILYTLHFTLLTPHSTLYTPRSTLYTPHSTLHTLHLTLHPPHSALYTPHSALCIPHFTLYTLHSTLYTLHFTLRTLHCTLHTPHFTLNTLHFTLYTLHSALLTPHFTLHAPHSTLHTPHFALYTWHSTLHTLHFTLHTPHFTLHTPHFTLHTLHFRLHALHFTLHTLHFTLHTLHSTLYTPHFTTLHSTLFTPHSAFFHVYDVSLSTRFGIRTIIIRVSIRVRGLHLVFQAPLCDHEQIRCCYESHYNLRSSGRPNAKPQKVLDLTPIRSFGVMFHTPSTRVYHCSPTTEWVKLGEPSGPHNMPSHFEDLYSSILGGWYIIYISCVLIPLYQDMWGLG